MTKMLSLTPMKLDLVSGAPFCKYIVCVIYSS